MLKKEDKKKQEKEKDQSELKINQILLKSRKLHLYEPIDNETACKLNKKILALSLIEKTPILLEINSPGGSITAGFSIVNTIKNVGIPVVTSINGIAASMGAVIALAGDYRVGFPNSYWMFHDATAGMQDYASKLKAKQEYLNKLIKKMDDFVFKNTKLTRNDIKKAKNEELWLSMNQCKKKGIIKTILKPKKVKIKK